MRAAKIICKNVLKASAQVTLSNHRMTANCKSCFDLMELLAPEGTVLELAVEGDNAQNILNTLCELFDHKFYEDEFAVESSPARSVLTK